MAQMNLKSETKLKKLRKDFIAEATELELTNDYLFVNTFNAFEDQIAFMDDLKRVVADCGLMVLIPVGKDGSKQAVNPAVAEYNKMATLANKSSATLISMIAEKKKETPVNTDDLV